jgi:type IV pilus biogenesis protein CpaD/CtpE
VDYPTDRYSNADSPFYGCISAANLRATVVEPGDLDAGRALGPANGDQQIRAIQAYRLGRVKAFQGASASGASSGGASGATGASSSGSGP